MCNCVISFDKGQINYFFNLLIPVINPSFANIFILWLFISFIFSLLTLNMKLNLQNLLWILILRNNKMSFKLNVFLFYADGYSKTCKTCHEKSAHFQIENRGSCWFYPHCINRIGLEIWNPKSQESQICWILQVRTLWFVFNILGGRTFFFLFSWHINLLG